MTPNNTNSRTNKKALKHTTPDILQPQKSTNTQTPNTEAATNQPTASKANPSKRSWDEEMELAEEIDNGKKGNNGPTQQNPSNITASKAHLQEGANVQKFARIDDSETEENPNPDKNERYTK